MLASDWAKKYFLCPIRGQHSNKSWNWFVKGSIPGSFSSVFENFRRRFSRPNWPPLGFRGWNESMQVSYFSRLRKEARATRKTRGICGTTAPHGIFFPQPLLSQAACSLACFFSIEWNSHVKRQLEWKTTIKWERVTTDSAMRIFFDSFCLVVWNTIIHVKVDHRVMKSLSKEQISHSLITYIRSLLKYDNFQYFKKHSFPCRS